MGRIDRGGRPRWTPPPRNVLSLLRFAPRAGALDGDPRVFSAAEQLCLRSSRLLGQTQTRPSGRNQEKRVMEKTHRVTEGTILKRLMLVVTALALETAAVGPAHALMVCAKAAPGTGSPKANAKLVLRAECKAGKEVPLGIEVSGSPGTDGRVLFTGVNVQVVDGSGDTAGEPNGLGNLVVGYDARNSDADSKSGSHNLVVGDDHSYASFGGFVAGHDNSLGGASASVSGGEGNHADGFAAAVSGGRYNGASGFIASVSGGAVNSATSAFASVSGGMGNVAGPGTPVQVPANEGDGASVSGGSQNHAKAATSSVSGGEENRATAPFASVTGGVDNDAVNYHAWVGGGGGNIALGFQSSVSGGDHGMAVATSSTVSGGKERVAFGDFDWIAGTYFAQD
jgi:hypothetical protein